MAVGTTMAVGITLTGSHCCASHLKRCEMKIGNQAYTRILWQYKAYATNATQQGPSLETDNISAGQEIPCLLRKPKAHYSSHKSPPLISVPSHTNTIHIIRSHFFKTHLVSAYHLHLGLSSNLFPLVVAL